MRLHADEGGAGDDLLLLLHGLGTTAAVWQPMLATAAANWHGHWLAPDLRGHGASPAGAGYSPGQFASDVADLLAERAPEARTLTILGHSLGGVVALALASGWFGHAPARVFGLGIKVAWTDDELARLTDLAARPARTFATEGEAVGRYLKVSGLEGVAGPDSPSLARGITSVNGGWKLAADPRANAVGAPPMPALIAVARCPVHLGRGETDALVSTEALRTFDPAAAVIAGVGHNAMVEAPERVWAWLTSHRDG
jgi:pimeloyl-ACP methyl ester carboxylesterase